MARNLKEQAQIITDITPEQATAAILTVCFNDALSRHPDNPRRMREDYARNAQRRAAECLVAASRENSRKLNRVASLIMLALTKPLPEFSLN